jgi:GTP-binding protein Era
MNKSFKSGFVSILGRPNAGKSTLLNALIGQKVAIVADKPQTTRTSIQGVLTLPEAQIVFLDTPGIHKADTPLNKRLMNAVRASLDQRDLLLFVPVRRGGPARGGLGAQGGNSRGPGPE